MTSFATLWSSLKLDITDFSKKLTEAAGRADRFGRDLKGKMTSSTAAVDELAKATKKSGIEFKDVARIVQGIIISKIFYSGLNAIRRATDAVWEFSSSLEYAKIAYSNLFSDTALAEEFINVLKDFAALTPFSFSESEAAAKRLLAYGMKYENVMYVMQGIMSAASMQGDPTKVEAISRAIGQIYTKGRLMGDEMKQLSEAGIPAYEILIEKLGLTQKELQNLGKQSIPASKAINALIDGMTERFGDVVTASSKTVKGIISNIQDNASMLASSMFEPMFNNMKAVFGALGDFLFELREIQETIGTGGVFERLVPPELRESIRLLVANFKAFNQMILNVIGALGQALIPALLSIVNVLNAVMPVLTTVLNVLAGVLSEILSSSTAIKVLTALLTFAAAAWVMFKVQAVAAAIVSGVIWLINKALMGMAALMTLIVAHPFWAILSLGVGILIALSGGFTAVGNAVRNFLGQITKLNGYDPDKMLLPSQKDRTNDLNKFNKALSGTSDAMDDLADSTGKAAKAGKSLLSFDEVFKLNDPDDKSTGSALDLEDFNLDLSGLELDSSAYIPEVPDFTGFVDNWYDKLEEAFRNKLKNASIGALLGGLIGGLIGGPVGAIVGTAIGGLVGWITAEIVDAFANGEGTKGTALSTALSGLIGAAIGFLIGGPAGAVIGAAIGSLVGWITGEITDGIVNGDWSGAATAIGTGLGAAIGFIVGGPAGALIGAGIGALVGFISEKLAEVDWEAVGQSIKDWADSVGQKIKDWADNVKEAFSTWYTDTKEKVVSWVAETATNIASWYTNTKEKVLSWTAEVTANIASWYTSTKEDILSWTAETATKIASWYTDTKEKITSWAAEAIVSIASWYTDTKEKIASWAAEAIANVASWYTSTKEKIASWAAETVANIASWYTNTKEKITSWAAETAVKIASWYTSTKEKITSWYTSTKEKITSWTAETAVKFASWYTKSKEKLDAFMNISFKDWCESALTTLGNWADDVWGKISDKIGKAIDKVKEFFNIKNDNNEFRVDANVSSKVSGGHATGGIFNREHVAKFAEGNKAEAIIPLENASAMQPFVDAVANGLTASLAPIVSSVSGGSQLQPLYVGTLIADDRSLKELERKMKVIRLQEERR